ncbi:MAG: type II secretion system protein [Cyanobacteria bacterium J06597_1]
MGFTLLETIVALAVIGIATSIGIAGWNNARNRFSTDAFASEIRSQIQSARFEAIKRNRHVAIFFDDTTESLRTVVKDASNNGCDIDTGDLDLTSGTVAIPDVAELNSSMFVGGSFMTQGGIVWRPTGLTGRCSNFNAQGFNTLKVRFEAPLDSATDFDIAISSAGRVELRK